MTDMRLYAVPIPGAGQTATPTTQRQQQSLQALLGTDIGNVESIAPEPGERRVTVQFPDGLGEIRAAEVAELANSLSQPLPFVAQSGQSRDDGYVTASEARVQPIDPRATEFQEARLTLSDVGTPASHWRAVRTNPQSVDNPFGSGGTAEVGIPALADKIRWLDEATGTRSSASTVATRTAKGGDVAVYDAGAPSIDQPVLIYEISLQDIRLTDPRVWDDRGEDSVTTSGRVVWQKVFASEHRYDGVPVVENGLIRLFLDESNGITAERWDPGTTSWSSQSLGASSWSLYDADIRRIGLAGVRARLEFSDGSTFHSLDMRLDRGFADPLWTNPDNEGSVPSGLIDLLDPIAAPDDAAPVPRQGLVPRDEVV